MISEKVNMPLLGDAFPELEVQTTHGQLNIPGDLIGEVMTIAASTREDVLNR